MTAVEALRRARATAACTFDETGQVIDGCWFRENAPNSVEVATDDLRWRNSDVHRWHASALLDGFSVEEVTAAEHTTEEPHE